MIGPRRVFQDPSFARRNCIAVNGGFFGTSPYVEGKKGDPSGDTTDCHGKVYKDPTWPPKPKKDEPPIKYIQVITNHGSIYGRLPSTPGEANPGHVDRTGACLDSHGKLLAVIVAHGVTFGGLDDCLKKNCPDGTTTHVLLDGGGSTQMIQSGNPTHPMHGFGVQPRPVLDWIVICEPPRVMHE